MDFSKIDNILVSNSVSLESLRPGFLYVHVALFASQINNTTPLIFAYIFKNKLKNANGKNSLKHWQFINNKSQSFLHQIDSFKTVKE